MEFVRQIIDSNALEPILTLPPSFRDSQVEIIVLTLDNPSSRPVNQSSYGRLKAYANPSLIPEEVGAWEKAAMDFGNQVIIAAEAVGSGAEGNSLPRMLDSFNENMKTVIGKKNRQK